MWEFCACEFCEASDACERVAEVVRESSDHSSDCGEAFLVEALFEQVFDGLGHVVDFCAESCEFVLSLNWYTVLEIACADVFCRASESSYGCDHPALEECDAQREDECCEQGRGEYDDEEFSREPVGVRERECCVVEEA